jgi:primosomal protein N'
MSDLTKQCNAILAAMRAGGLDACETCDDWADEDIEYFVVNYNGWITCRYCGHEAEDGSGVCVSCYNKEQGR